MMMIWTIPKTTARQATMWAAVAGLVVAFTGCRPSIPRVEETPEYKYEVANGTVTITKYKGSGRSVSIPNALGGLPVTSIGDEAFAGCDSLTSVMIPDSVTNVGRQAFTFCESLTNAMIGRGVTRIGVCAFYTCFGSSLTNVYFKGNAPNIGGAAFASDVEMTIYHLPGTKGWGTNFADRPTAIWNPQTNATVNAKSK